MGSMDEAAKNELHALAVYVSGCRAATERDPAREDIWPAAVAYIGGALTTMLHLGHLTDTEHASLFNRLTEDLGPEPEGHIWLGG